jgi:hypothetical protein
MTDCFPEMVMPDPEPASEPEPLPLTDEIIQEQLDIEESEDPYEVEEVEEVQAEQTEEEIIPEPKRRTKIPQEEIFSAPKVKTILEKEEVQTGYIPKGRTKAGVGTRKKRGPATPEQLERLARGREKAKETRLRKKQEKEERLKKEKEDKELVEAIRDRERKKLRKKLETPIEEEDKPLPQPQVKIVEKDRIIEKGYSQADLDDAVARAVEQSVNRVEVLRKNRKEAKKKAEAKAKHDAAVFHEVNRALKNDVWQQCFI